MKILTALTASSGLDVSSNQIDNIILGTSGTQNNDINVDNLTVWANSQFKNNVVLGSNAQDTITALAPITASSGISASVFVGDGSKLINVAGGSHSAVSIGTSNGLSIDASQTLSLAAASNTTNGAFTTGSQVLSGSKTLSGSLNLTSDLIITNGKLGIGINSPSSRFELSGTDGYITLNAISSTLAPANNKMSLFAEDYAGRTMLHQQSSDGKHTSFQPNIAHNSIGTFLPQGANTTTIPPANGIGFTTVVGTATGRAIATTNALTRMRRIGLVSATPAGSLTHVRSGSGTTGTAQFTTGDGASWALGGFLISFRFGISDASLISGARMFIGLNSSTAAPTNVDPASIIQSIGIAQLSNDSNQLYIVYGGTATQTIALGTDFGINNTTPYEFSIYSPSTLTGVIKYEVTNLSTGVSVSGTLTGNSTVLPNSSTLLAIHAWRTNNASVGAVGLDLGGIYVETEQ